jgi:anaerobic magnesium-protoporphyrin IX monomethyl ester cyclase
MYEDVLLVKPPGRSFFNFGTFSLGVLAAAIRDLTNVTILDATDMSESEAAEQIWSRPHDLVGVTVMGLASMIPARDFLRQLDARRRRGPETMQNACILVGGHGASVSPEMFIDAGADAVVVGEGELVLRRIVQDGIQAGSPGLACCEGAGVVHGPRQPLVDPLDDLQPPARDLMPRPDDDIHLMETSRGCPHDCNFCETTRFYGRRWRAHTPERVAAEVRRLVDEHDAWIIHVTDDNFTANPRRVGRICELVGRGMLPAFFMVSARGDDLVADPVLLPAMAAARFLRVTVGVETLGRDAASAAGKPISLETYRQAFLRMRELGMFSIASFIVGLPGETPCERQRAVELAVEAGPDSAHFLPFLPIPGIPLASGRDGWEPDPQDVQDADRFNCQFFEHPLVRSRLDEAVAAGGIRGTLARGTLEQRIADRGLAPAGS